MGVKSSGYRANQMITIYLYYLAYMLLYSFFSSEQILTLSAQLFNVHTTWKKEKDKQTCSKKGKGNTQPTDKKISNSENLNCSTKPKLILSDKILTPMSKVMYLMAVTCILASNGLVWLRVPWLCWTNWCWWRVGTHTCSTVPYFYSFYQNILKNQKSV